MKLPRRQNSKFWWYDFTIRGRRFRGSTKETNENRAAKVAALKVADACKRGDPLPRKAPTLLEASVRFLKWVDSARLEPKTKTYYKDGWRLLKEKPIVSLRLDTLDREIIEQLQFPGSAPNANCALRTLSRLLHKAIEWKLIRNAPKIKLLAEEGRSLVLNDVMEKKLLEGAKQCNWRPKTLERFCDIVALVRDTGMRNERELYQVALKDIDFDAEIISIPDSKTPKGVRRVPMSDRVTEIVRRRTAGRREVWLFPSKRAKCGHLTTVAGLFRRARTKAGLQKELVLYCGRHDFGTRLLKKTGNLKLVMDAMGHVDPKTAMKYQHPELELVRKALNEPAGETT